MTSDLLTTPPKALEKRDIFQPNFLNIQDNISADLLIYGHSKPDVISLAQGDNVIPTPAFICDAAHEAMIKGKTHYGPVLGQPVLKNALSDYYKNIFQTNIDPKRIFVSSSGTTSLHLALESILKEGDEVVCITPIWRNIMGIIGLTGARAVQVPLEYDGSTNGGGWTLDMEKVFAACNERTKAILVVSPSNPTGWIMSEEERLSMLEFSRERGLWIIADEVYNRLAYEEKATKSFLEIAKEDDLLYSVNSFSKAWSMTGWRLGWLVGPKVSAPVIQDIALYENMGAPSFNQYGAVAALQGGEDFIAEQKSLWKDNLDIIEERFGKNKKILFTRPDATFYAFFKIVGEDDCVQMCRRLIDEAGVSLAPGGSFGDGFEGWIRMCFAVSKEELIEALNRIESFL